MRYFAVPFVGALTNGIGSGMTAFTPAPVARLKTLDTDPTSTREDHRDRAPDPR